MTSSTLDLVYQLVWLQVQVVLLEEFEVLLEELEVQLGELEVIPEEPEGLGAQLVALEVLGSLRLSIGISHICFTLNVPKLTSCDSNKVAGLIKIL